MDEEDSFRLRPPEQAFAAKDDRLIPEKTGPEKGRRSQEPARRCQLQ